MAEKSKKEKRPRDEADHHHKHHHSRGPATITFKNFPNVHFSIVDGKFYPQHVFGYMTVMLEAHDTEKEVSTKQPDGSVIVNTKKISTQYILLPGKDGGVPVKDKHVYTLQQLSELPPKVKATKTEAAGMKGEIAVKEEPESN